MSKVIGFLGLCGLVVLSVIVIASRDDYVLEQVRDMGAAGVGSESNLQLGDSSRAAPEDLPENMIQRKSVTPPAAVEVELEPPERSPDAELLARARWNFGDKARKPEQILANDFFNPTGKRLNGDQIQGLVDLLGEINEEMRLLDQEYAHKQSDVISGLLEAGHGTVRAIGPSGEGPAPMPNPEQEVSVALHRGRLLELRISFGDDAEYDRYRTSVAERKGEAIERIREYVRNAK